MAKGIEWRNTTHDWAAGVDHAHLQSIRAAPATMVPGGIRQLILEVVAYAADEAESRGTGRCLVGLHADGSVSVSDDGRGTDTRIDEQGKYVKKPIMASKDLRFFDFPEAQSLPDGSPRRGISVVAALSRRLEHTNRRANGAWTQHYEYGVPVTDLLPVAANGTTGTTVRFLPEAGIPTTDAPRTDELLHLTECWPHLSVRVEDERTT
ncbi:hypothetical protein [Nocardia sp. CA-290969]|uniref:hypothetical protein n=1 Tax=Nocardia sp. CA-290969 TaxID=3239986 RepID=UPI003D93CB92